MLQGIVNRAQRSIDTLVSKYVTRIAVAVPFVIALGFGTAAASIKLTEEFGSTFGHMILAGTFAAIGLAAAAAIAMSGPNPLPVSVPSEPGAAVPEAVSDDGASGVSPELLMTAIGAIGPAALPGLIRLIARNMPLILLAVILSYLLFSNQRDSEPRLDPSTN